MHEARNCCVISLWTASIEAFICFTFCTSELGRGMILGPRLCVSEWVWIPGHFFHLGASLWCIFHVESLGTLWQTLLWQHWRGICVHFLFCNVLWLISCRAMSGHFLWTCAMQWSEVYFLTLCICVYLIIFCYLGISHTHKPMIFKDYFEW